MTLSKKKLFEKLLNFQRNEKGDVGTLMMVFYAVIIVVAIAVAFTLAGVIGSSVESSVTIPGYSDPVNQTGALPGSGWNSSVNPAIVTGAEVWTTQGALLSAVVIIAVAAMALAALFAIFGGGGGVGGGLGKNGGGGGM